MAHLGSPVHGLGVLWGDTPRKKEQMKMMKMKIINVYIHFTRVRMEVLVLIGLHLRHNVITNREKTNNSIDILLLIKFGRQIIL